MQLYYGSDAFAVNSVNVASRIQNVLNAAGIAVTRKVFMTVTGDLLVDTASADPALSAQLNLTTQTNNLVVALRTNYLDLVLQNDDGSQSGTILTNAGSLSGVVITSGPDFPGGVNTSEYVARRAFTFEAMCEYVCTNSPTGLRSFSESLDFRGGGPVYIMARAINGLPQRQKPYSFTEYCVTQSGQAIGLLAMPIIPPPKFPFALKEAPKIRRSGPERIGPNYQNYGVTWSYEFEWHAPLIGVPTLWT